MNYLRELKIVKEGLALELATYHTAVLDLISYLSSDKFRENTTVQVSDVIRRLQEAESAALDARTQYDNAAYANERMQEQIRRDKPKRKCERCDKLSRDCEDVPMHGHYERLCPGCFHRAEAAGESPLV